MIVVTGTGDVVDVAVASLQQMRASYLVTLTDANGTVWSLNEGPVTLLAGTKLFDTPPITPWTKSSAAVAGTRWKGAHVDEQTYMLPVRITGADWETYRSNDKAFFAGVYPGAEVVVTVTAPDSASRSISCRFLSPGDLSDDTDPLILKRRTYQLSLLAPDPFWYGDVVRQPLAVGTPAPLLVPPGPPIIINPPNAATAAAIRNPGDVAAWWRATVTAGFSGFTVGVGDAVVSSSTPYGTGRRVDLDSSPRRRSITDETGARVYRDMDTVGFAPIPPGAEVPIVVDVTGFDATTSVVVELTPLYWRPL